MHTLHWRGHGYLGFERGFISVRYTYGDTVDDSASVVGCSSVSVLIGDDEDWNFDDFWLSRDAVERSSLHVDFTAIWTRCRNFIRADLDKASYFIGLALRGLDAQQETGRSEGGSRHWKQVGQSSWPILPRWRVVSAS